MTEFIFSLLLYYAIGYLYILKEAEVINLFCTAGVISLLYGVFSYICKFKGGHYNSAITIGYVYLGKINVSDGLKLITIQLFSGILSCFFLSLTVNDKYLENSVSQGNSVYVEYRITVFGCFLLEIIFSLFISYAYCTFNYDIRNPRKYAFISVFISYFISICACYEFTGAGLNPSKVLGFNIYTGYFRYAWIYVFGPILGAVIMFNYYNKFIFQEFQLNNLNKKKYIKNIVNKNKLDF